MPARFNPPPGWPRPPAGWEPQEGWLPEPSWPPPPPGWQFWVNENPEVTPPRSPQPWADYRPVTAAHGNTAPTSPAAALFGWGGLAATAVIAFLSGGFSSLMVMIGLYVAAVAVVALIRGHVDWAQLHRRGVAGAVAALAIVALVIGGATAAPTAPAPGPAAAPVATGTSAPTARTAPADPVEVTLKRAGSGTALGTLATLPVQNRPAPGYSDRRFDQTWADTDGNRCDQRNDVLRRDLLGKTLAAGTRGCTVYSGRLVDPYTGATAALRGPATAAIRIDRVVSLSDAWAKGASRWTSFTRSQFANDPANLQAVAAATLVAKSGADAATWLPSVTSYRCAYVARQVAIKKRYGLAVSSAERKVMVGVLNQCPGQRLPRGQAIRLGGAPIDAATTFKPARTAPAPPPTPTQARRAGVQPGAFCSPEGALGTTTAGTLMRCTSKNGDQARWRAA